MKIRKVATFVEQILVEGFREASRPLTVSSAMAVVQNPFAGRYVDNLFTLVDDYSEHLGTLLSQRAAAALDGGAASVEAFGKGAIVGTDGEIEHSVAIIHNLRFGTPVRDLVDATNLLVGSDKRGAPGATLDVPLKHVRAETGRDHYMSHEVRVPDAPRSDEILVVVTLADGTRVHPRSGSMGNELTR